MNPQSNRPDPIPALQDLEMLPYIDDQGKLPAALQGKIGVYGIFDARHTLQYVGYSRDIYLSLKQHLVRQPQLCYGVKAQTIDRPNRTILEDTQHAWMAENGTVPAGNGPQFQTWTQSIDVKPLMTPEEMATHEKLDEIDQEKLLKDVARRVEAGILADLQQRGVTEEIRFNPKLKTSGLLDLK
ncbi:MAG: GIY-YIG nuclease family protein [Oscillatoriales cyanobacterium RM2_1_1]|nr:GIY-YIG nuclease family protein [Oscillatoriales cyanobacterium SM2_3_0]NJO46595.1 GIY-YIG nuclease family protein [Oscillatoriales cyanobacterium RM2_1_1]